MMRIIKDWIVGEKALNADGSPMLDDKGQPIYSAVDGDASGGRFNSLYEDENGIVFNAGGPLSLASTPGTTEWDRLVHKILSMYLNIDKSLEIQGYESLGRKMYFGDTDIPD